MEKHSPALSIWEKFLLFVICPFGAISAYVNHYSSPRREWNVGMTIGWQLFNYRFVE